MQQAEELLKTNLPEEYHKSVAEITDYLVESFGNATRIDYGTGHEMSFCMFLCCLFKIGAFKENDCVAVVNKVFQRLLSFDFFVEFYFILFLSFGIRIGKLLFLWHL